MTLQANKIIQKTFNSFILFASGRQECTLLFRFELLFTLLDIIKSIDTDVVNILHLHHGVCDLPPKMNFRLRSVAVNFLAA